MADSLRTIFIYVNITGFSVVALSHLVGLCLLCRAKNGLENQKAITMNLAVSELLNSLYQVFINAKMLTGRLNMVWTYIDACFAIFLLLNNRFVMVHMITDRFLDIYLNLKYQLIFTKGKLQMVMFGIWIFSAVVGVTVTLVGIYKTGFFALEGVISYTFFALDILITILATSTFIYFHYKISQLKKRERSMRPSGYNNRDTHQNSAQRSRRFFVPGLMILSYLVLNVSAAVVIMAVQFMPFNSSWLIMYEVSNLLIILGFFSDSCIYIFAQKSVRSQIKGKILPQKSTGTSISTIS